MVIKLKLTLHPLDWLYINVFLIKTSVTFKNMKRFKHVKFTSFYQSLHLSHLEQSSFLRAKYEKFPLQMSYQIEIDKMQHYIVNPAKSPSHACVCSMVLYWQFLTAQRFQTFDKNVRKQHYLPLTEAIAELLSKLFKISNLILIISILTVISAMIFI